MTALVEDLKPELLVVFSGLKPIQDHVELLCLPLPFTTHRIVKRLLSPFLRCQYVVCRGLLFDQFSRLCDVIDGCTETVLKSAPG